MSTIKHKDQNVSIGYIIDIWYDMEEEDVDEMCEDNISDDEDSDDASHQNGI